MKDATIAVSGSGEDSLGSGKSVTFDKKLTSTIELQGKQQMQIKFAVVNDKAQPITVHQAFVIFVHSATKREVAYVAEPDTQTKIYTFDLNLKTHAKEFSGVSGKYEAHVILGDVTVINPVDWHIADVDVKISAVKAVELPKSQRVVYEKQPEIQHLFREPEKRPPNVAADAFSLLCAAPLVILLASWLRIGINYGNFPISLWPLLFHAALTATFALYFVFWLRLNMFVTLKYLGFISVVTFFTGHRLFRALAKQRKVTSA